MWTIIYDQLQRKILAKYCGFTPMRNNPTQETLATCSVRCDFWCRLVSIWLWLWASMSISLLANIDFYTALFRYLDYFTSATMTSSWQAWLNGNQATLLRLETPSLSRLEFAPLSPYSNHSYHGWTFFGYLFRPRRDKLSDVKLESNSWISST
jgi:hypothetical protein